MDQEARTERPQVRRVGPRAVRPTSSLSGLSDFFPRELSCANCGARFVTRVRDGDHLCPVCFSGLAEAARSRRVAARRRCA
ncbi:MAG: hypothetical protein ABSG81_10895 [Acidimicrobiales bacterium]